MKIKIVFFILCILLFTNAYSVNAQPMAFNFDDPKGVNAMSIYLDSTIEPIIGTATGITGQITFDPDKPDVSNGYIKVAADQIRMTNPTMTRHLHSEDWMDVKKYPLITCEFMGLKSPVKKIDNRYEAIVVGKFTLHGITKTIEVPVSVTYLPDQAKAKYGKGNGDLLVLRTHFVIDRADYGIMPKLGPQKVARNIKIKVGIVGFVTK